MTTHDQERVRIEREVRARATRRVYHRIAFRWHLAVFLLVNAALVAINMRYSPDTLWFVWPLAAWGAGLLMHGLAMQQSQGSTADQIEAEIQRELQRRGLV